MRLLQTGEADAEKSIQKKKPYRNPGELLLKTTQELQEALAKKKKAKYEGMSLHLYLVTHSI